MGSQCKGKEKTGSRNRIGIRCEMLPGHGRSTAVCVPVNSVCARSSFPPNHHPTPPIPPPPPSATASNPPLLSSCQSMAPFVLKFKVCTFYYSYLAINSPPSSHRATSPSPPSPTSETVTVLQRPGRSVQKVRSSHSLSDPLTYPSHSRRPPRTRSALGEPLLANVAPPDPHGRGRQRQITPRVQENVKEHGRTTGQGQGQVSPLRYRPRPARRTLTDALITGASKSSASPPSASPPWTRSGGAQRTEPPTAKPTIT